MENAKTACMILASHCIILLYAYALQKQQPFFQEVAGVQTAGIDDLKVRQGQALAVCAHNCCTELKQLIAAGCH